jgi:hypothetical protein
VPPTPGRRASKRERVKFAIGGQIEPTFRTTTMLCPEPIQPRRWRNVCTFWRFVTSPTTSLVAMFAIVAIAAL